jgi:lysozyme family protein
MAKYPNAIWKPFPGVGAYVSAPYKIVHHTTEGGSAAGAIATYAQTKAYPHFTVEDDVVYQHVDTETAVTALEHHAGTPETNRSSAIQIELVGFAGKPKSPTSLKTMATLCRWLEQQHKIATVWPNGKPYPPVNGDRPDVPFNRDAHTWATQGGHYGHCHVPNNSHWDPGYTEDEVAQVMAGAVAQAEAEAAYDAELASIPEMAASAEAAISPYVQSLVRIAKAEYAAYNGFVETEEPLRSRINEYCRGIGIAPPSDVSAFPWSATFVSWCVKQAGATRDEFRFSAEHSVFVQAAIRNADAGTGVFRGRRVEDYAPRVGDLVQRNRSGGAITYDQARRLADYPSHSAIVVEVGEDRQGLYATTIGGNESDTVGRKRVALDADGLVVQNSSNPFICIVQDLKIDAAAAGARAQAAPSGRRFAMAKLIVGYEAKRDSQGRLAIAELGADDGGGRYEVAGINERYNKTVCDELVALINAGQQDEAEQRATAYIADQTDRATDWTSNAAVEFYLRDCIFNRGAGGAAWILQTAVGVKVDGAVGPQTRAAVAQQEGDPQTLLARLREAREARERLHRDESSRYWKGLVNRWNRALVDAKAFLTAGAQAPGGDAPVPPAPPAPLPPKSVMGGDGEYDAPDATPAAAPAASAVARSQAVAAPAVKAAAAPELAELHSLHGRLAQQIFAHHARASALAAPANTTARQKAVVGVGIGAARRDMGSIGPAGPGAPVLNVYVAETMDMDSVKQALVDHFDMQELRPDRQRVNVFHTGRIAKQSQLSFARPSPCGVSVGHIKVTAGTQGALARGLKDERRKRLLLLSNNHVLANSNDAQAKDPIYQPGRIDMGPAAQNPGPFQIGILEQWVPIDFTPGAQNVVDCATAWCWPDRVRRDFVRPDNAGGSEYFRVGATPKEAVRQMQVGKSGRTTEMTIGEVLDVHAAIAVDYEGHTASFVDQITIKGPDIKPFSAGGDSGSLIWTWDADRAPIGLLFAGGNGITFANKIQHVLEALDIELQT